MFQNKNPVIFIGGCRAAGQRCFWEVDNIWDGRSLLQLDEMRRRAFCGRFESGQNTPVGGIRGELRFVKWVCGATSPMSIIIERGSFSRSDHAWQVVAHRLVLGSCIYVKRRYTLLSRYRISYSVVHYSFDISSIDSAIVCNWCASTWEGPKGRDYIRFSNSDFYGRLTLDIWERVRYFSDG